MPPMPPPILGMAGAFFCGTSPIIASVFALADPKVSPSALASMLQANPHFGEAGYMLPNER